MWVVGVPIAVLLLLYAPGRTWLPVCGIQGSTAHRLLLEILVSASLTSWIGLFLAEAGMYSLYRLCALQVCVAVAGALANRRRAAPRYGQSDLAGIAVMFAACLWLSPPLDTRLLSGDSTGYLASSTLLAHSGSLVVHDTSLDHLSLDQQRILFPSVAFDRGSPPYLRLLGAYVLRDLGSDELLPAFHHLLNVWLAIVVNASGEQHQEWLIILFGGLAVWAIAAFAYSAIGVVGAVAVAAALLLQLPQYWYSRFLMPEIPAQFFLWSGLVCLLGAVNPQQRSARLACIGGIAFGIAALMRLENAIFVAAAFAGARVLARRGDRNLSASVLGAGIVWVHLALHSSCWRTHYWGNIQAVLYDLPPWQSTGAVAVMALLLLVGLSRVGQALIGKVSLPVWVAGLLGVGLAVDYGNGWPSLRLLAAYSGVAMLAPAAAGLLCLRPADSEQRQPLTIAMLLVAAAAVQFLIAPHATPVAIWAIRRAVMLLLPGVALCFGALIAWIMQRWRSPLLASVVAALILGSTARGMASFRSHALYSGSRHHLAVLSEHLAPHSILLIDPRLTGYGFGPQLWALRDSAVYYVAGSDRERLPMLTEALGERPIYWLGDANAPAPSVPDVEFAPILLYEFSLVTPQLELDAPADSIVATQAAVALYQLSVPANR